MFKYSARDINELSKNTGFQKDMLEKVLRLIEVLKFINSNDVFEPLKLKGGTALGLTKFNFKRLSVDIDFDFSGDLNQKEVLIRREEIKNLVIRYMETNGYTLDIRSKFPYSLDSFVFKYINLRGNPDNILIEINYTNRIHVLTPILETVSNEFVEDLEINVLSDLELYATKINALINRTTPRDVYDTFLLIKHSFINDQNIEEIRKIVLFYFVLSSHKEDYKNKIINSQSIIKKLDYNKLKRTLIPVLSKKDDYNHTEVSLIVNQLLDKLLQINKEELLFLKDANNLNIKLELIFDDNDIIQRLNSHPRILWLTR